MSKSLIIYFSRADENYAVGYIPLAYMTGMFREKYGKQNMYA